MNKGDYTIPFFAGLQNKESFLTDQNGERVIHILSEDVG